MATKKTHGLASQPAATKPAIGMSPRRASKAELKVDAKRPSTKAAKERTDPVAVAGQALVKAASKRSDPSLPGVPVVKVRTLGDLRKAILEFPVSNTFTTDQKFGTDLIHIQNIRGRTVAQIQVEKKAKSTPRSDKL
jgi:hypothetical protein